MAIIDICVSGADLSRAICINSGRAIVLLTGIVNVVTDFYLLALPVYPIMQLNLKHRQKLGLLSIFMAGLM